MVSKYKANLKRERQLNSLLTKENQELKVELKVTTQIALKPSRQEVVSPRMVNGFQSEYTKSRYQMLCGQTETN